MPAIYRFPLLGPNDPATLWGWHRTTELVDAFNNILAIQRKEPMTTAEICRTYPAVNLLVKWNAKGELYNLGKWTLMVDRDGCACRISDLCNYEPGQDWLAGLIAQDVYIPARLGMELLRQVKYSIEEI